MRRGIRSQKSTLTPPPVRLYYYFWAFSCAAEVWFASVIGPRISAPPLHSSLFHGRCVHAIVGRFAVLIGPEIVTPCPPLPATRDYRVCSLASAGYGLGDQLVKVPCKTVHGGDGGPIGLAAAAAGQCGCAAAARVKTRAIHPLPPSCRR